MKKFLKGVTFATALTFTVSPVFTSPVNAFNIDAIDLNKVLSNKLTATFVVSEPVSEETISLAWFDGVDYSSEPKEFSAAQGEYAPFQISVQPGDNILGGKIDNKQIAVLLQVPNDIVDKIDEVYPATQSFTVDDYKYYVLEENLIVDANAEYEIESGIIFNAPGNYPGIDIIAVDDPIAAFEVFSGAATYHAFVIDTQANIGEDDPDGNAIISMTTTPGITMTHGDFEYELVSIDEVIGNPGEVLDATAIDEIQMHKEGNRFRLYVDGNQYLGKVVYQIKITGKENTPAQGISHTITMLDAGDVKTAIAIDGVETPTTDLP